MKALGPKYDIVGETFTKLKVLRQDGKIGTMIAYLCECSCGNIVRVGSFKLTSGRTKSCGCWRKPRSHGLNRTPEHNAWKEMRKRCLNSNSAAFPRYGGRGITICSRWDSFENFIADMGEKPSQSTHSKEKTITVPIILIIVFGRPI